MARTKIEIDKSDLVAVINRLESVNKFNNRSQLLKAVADEMNISTGLVMLRIKEFSIEPKTPIGKRGRAKGSVISDSQKKAMQEGRKKAKVAINVSEVRRNFPDSYNGLINKLETGSLKAAIKAKCLDCCNFDVKEIKNCQCVACPLYSFRPYV